MKRSLPAICLAVVLTLDPAFAQTSGPAAANEATQQGKPYVVLVSLDGFRYDYARKFGAAHLEQLGRAGITAEALTPAYPTLTFPNHYSIATGLYPAHHGIVDNTFYDPKRDATYTFHDDAAATDGSWYGGTPLWVLAEQQGMRAACFFWPGSDADIQHVRPTFYYRYDGSVPNQRRIERAIEWLNLPKAQRPHFITLYFSDVDSAGHRYGQEAPETREAVRRVDEIIGELTKSIAATGVPVNVFVVSDHGMLAVEGEPVDLSKYADLSRFHIAEGVAQMMLYSRDRELIATSYAALNGKDPRFAVYRKEDLPARLHYSDNPRIGDLVIMATAPVLLSAHAPDPHKSQPKGMHGYDVEKFPEMRGIFYAEGPDLKSGVRIPAFENVNIYPLIAHLLGLNAPKTDGSIEVLKAILRESR
jgi:predicted AlkP superfamily pyrophosphatase or phosphodiesterase